MPPTRSGSVMAISSATRPPMLLPARWARSRPIASISENTERAKNAASYAAPSGLTESPKPGRSMAITRWCSASADTVGRKEALVAPRP